MFTSLYQVRQNARYDAAAERAGVGKASGVAGSVGMAGDAGEGGTTGLGRIVAAGGPAWGVEAKNAGEFMKAFVFEIAAGVWKRQRNLLWRA